MPFEGNLYRKVTFPRLVEGEVDTAPILNRKVEYFRTFSESLSVTSSLLRKFDGSRLIQGEIGFEGVVEGLKAIFRNVAGALSFTHSLIARKLTQHRLIEGSLSFTPVLNRKVTFPRIVIGEFSASGVVYRTASYYRLTEGDLSFTHSKLSAFKKIMRKITGSLSFNLPGGGVTWVDDTVVWTDGTVVFADGGSVPVSLQRKVSYHRTSEGVLGTSAQLLRQVDYKRKVEGSIGWSGVVDWFMEMIQRTTEGILSFTSNLTRVVTFRRQSEGQLNAAGQTYRKFDGSRQTEGQLGFEGSGLAWRATGFYRKIVGALSFLHSKLETELNPIPPVKRAWNWFWEFFE